MKQSDDNKFIPMTSVTSGKETTVKEDLHYFTNQIVNVIFVGKAGSKDWVMIDAGMPESAGEIMEAAEKLYGKNSRPQAIMLTHGHFDHVGSIVELLEKWNVPVYAHPLEIPFLTGKESYPEPDPTVEGGLLAKISSYYPNEPTDISEVIQEFPKDNSVPGLPEWIWIHTPGHSKGHVSFFRASDKSLIAGDAFVTVRQDSFYRVLFQKKEMNGPPRYLTSDWRAAERSVAELTTLDPEMAICGHGPHMQGAELKQALINLSKNFKEIALPDQGKYVPKKDDGD